MDSHELQRAYGDSHTLDRPFGVEAASLHRTRTPAGPANPLDDPAVVEAARSQGWGC